MQKSTATSGNQGQLTARKGGHLLLAKGTILSGSVHRGPGVQSLQSTGQGTGTAGRAHLQEYTVGGGEDLDWGSEGTGTSLLPTKATLQGPSSGLSRSTPHREGVQIACNQAE